MSEIIVRDIIWLPRSRVTSKEVMQHVASRHGMTVDEMLTTSRERRFVRARQEAMWEIRQRTHLSLPQIAQRFGHKDHTSVLHAVRVHGERVAAGEA